MVDGAQVGRLDHEEEACQKAKGCADAIPLQQATVFKDQGQQLPREPAKPVQLW
jgi:hypothetical protein